MERDPERLAGETFDLLVVGGGIFGACLAWDAAQRGLQVALVEKDDFCGAASGNSFRMVHGGIRYIQHLDVRRLRLSAFERRTLFRIAPHAVRPLPVVIPTYGHGMQGKAALRAGFTLFDLLTPDRNRGVRDPSRRIPPCRFLDRQEVLALFPGLEDRGLTGAGLFHDGQMHDPARLGLAFLHSASEAGAVLANRTRATRLLRRGDAIVGARVSDEETGDEFDVGARVTVVAGGAWTQPLVATALESTIPGEVAFSRDLCLLTSIPAEHPYALAVLGDTRDPDSVLSRQRRHLFVVPWRERVIVGVWHRVYRKHPDHLEVEDAELDAFVDEIDRAYPALGLTRDDVTAYNTGLVLFGSNREGARDLSYGKRSRIVDYRTRGLSGLVSLIGVRYTTARADAAEALELALSHSGMTAPPCRTARTPVWGGDFRTVAGLEAEIGRKHPDLPTAIVRSLRRNHGSMYERVLETCSGDPELRQPLGTTSVLAGEVVYAVRNEMALHLEDVVLRRTDLGRHGTVDPDALEAAARLMAAELDWSDDRRLDEQGATLTRLRGPGRVVSERVTG